MQFCQLEAFIGVARYKSFSKAAEKLFISQPTVSAHIKSLEEETGVRLIERYYKDITLTDAGERFFSYATNLVNTRDAATADMSSFCGRISGTLHLAASTVPAQYLIPGICASMNNEYPDVHYNIAQQDSMAVIKSILSYEAEIGVCGTKTDESACLFERFFDDRLTIITPNNEYYRDMNGCMSISELRQSDFVCREEGSGTRIEAANFFREVGIDSSLLKNTACFGSTEGIKQAVREGLGISIISSLAAADYVHFGYLLAFDFDVESLNRSFNVVTCKKRILSPQAEYFRKYCLKQFRVK